MKARGIVVSLVVLTVCLIAAAPGFAQNPRSYAVIDPGGGIVECVDFKNSGVAKLYFEGRNGNFQNLDVSEITGTPGDLVYFGQVRNVVWEGFPASRVEFHGTCEAQGTSWWGFFAADWGNNSCSFTSFMRLSIGRFNNSSSMIELGPDARTCEALFGADEASVKRGPRKSK